MDEILLLWKLVNRELSSASEKIHNNFFFLQLEIPSLHLRPTGKLSVTVKKVIYSMFPNRTALCRVKFGGINF